MEPLRINGLSNVPTALETNVNGARPGRAPLSISPLSLEGLDEATSSREATPTAVHRPSLAHYQPGVLRTHRADSTNSLSPLSLNAQFNKRTKHRHSDKADEALRTLQEFSRQASETFDPLRGSENGSRTRKEPEDKGIIANLESHRWIYHGEKQGVRIFSRDEPDRGSSLEREGSSRSRGDSTLGHKTSVPSFSHSGVTGNETRRRPRGVSKHESMPFFRGEIFIPGRWRVEDVAATVRSIGARSIWDPRFDSSKSRLVAALSETDMLAHVHLLGAFPVGARDCSLVSSTFFDERDGVGYIASCSVDDALIPKRGTRSTVHLNGYCIRAVSSPPSFDAPPLVDSPVQIPEVKSPTTTRPQHRRARSSVSGLQSPLEGGTLASPPPPLPLYQPLQTIMPTLTRRKSMGLNHSNASPSSPAQRHSVQGAQRSRLIHRTSFTKGETRQEEEGRVSSPQEEDEAPDGGKPGLHVSFIMRASPGGNLPETYVNQLSLSLPLTLAGIERYLGTSGFAPYIVRADRASINILEERYDPHAGIYTVIYRVHPQEAPPDTRIRFWGSAFSRGRFNIEVQRAKEWRIEYDVPPNEAPDVVREEPELDTQTKRAPRRSSVSIASISSPPLVRTEMASPKMSSNRLSLPAPTYEIKDPARLPGPLGGCTLLVPNKGAENNTVVVTISKNADRARSGLYRIRDLSNALGTASKLSFDGRQPETIDDMVFCTSKEGQALANLELSRIVLEHLQAGKEKEQVADSLLRSPLGPTKAPVPVSSPASDLKSGSLGLGIA